MPPHMLKIVITVMMAFVTLSIIVAIMPSLIGSVAFSTSLEPDTVPFTLVSFFPLILIIFIAAIIIPIVGGVWTSSDNDTIRRLQEERRRLQEERDREREMAASRDVQPETPPDNTKPRTRWEELEV